MKIILVWGEILSEQFKRPISKYSNPESRNFWKIQGSEHNKRIILCRCLRMRNKMCILGGVPLEQRIKTSERIRCRLPLLLLVHKGNRVTRYLFQTECLKLAV